MPKALPSAAIALTRKSGCDQVIARLIVGSTVSTMPTSPSGATTGLYDRIPARPPRVRVSVYSSPSARLCSASAGTNPQPSEWPSPSARRSRSFSASNAGTSSARSATLSRASVSTSCRMMALRASSASLCIATSGAMNTRRSVEATGSRRCAGSASAANERVAERASSAMSARVPLARARAIDQLTRSRLNCSKPTSTCPRRRVSGQSRERHT